MAHASSYYSRAHICQCLSALRRRSSVMTIFGQRKRTGEEFVHGVLSLARGLSELGVASGDVVAICAFNSDSYLECLLAVTFVGGIVAPLNYRWSFEEAKSAMLSIRPVMFVTDGICNNWYSQLQENVVVPSLKWHVLFGSSDFTTLNKLTTDTLKKHMGCYEELNYLWAPEGAAIICFTSGTTGGPKGVVLGHTSMIVQSLAKIAMVGYSEDDVYLHTAQLCHIGGLSSALTMLMLGACHVLIPKFEAKLTIDAIEKHSVTSLITVPAMMADLTSSIRAKQTWTGKQSMKKILNGGGGLTRELIKDAVECFPRAKLVSAYGMTETCSSLTFITLSDPTLEKAVQIKTLEDIMNSRSLNQQQGVCVGKPAAHVELKVCFDHSSKSGRILTRGPHLMLQYWNQNIEKQLDSINDVWFDTRDIGSIDNNGNLWLLGRATGRIKSGGENVHPEEVEAVLLQHQGVVSAVVVGIPDARLGEMVVACIKLREGWQWSDRCCQALAEYEQVLCTEILQKDCREMNLTRFKVPRDFILWEKPFPVTTTGKIMRQDVQKEVSSHLQSLPSKL